MILNGILEGCWLAPDPLGGDITNPQSLNRYAYVLNNPTTFTDPTGLQCEPWAQCVNVTAEAPSVWLTLFADFYLGSWPNTPINFPSPVSHPGGGRVLPPPKPAPSGPLPSYWQVAKNFNQCAANVADKYSAASVLHLNNIPVLGSVLGSSTAAASNLVFGTRPSQYVPAGANLTAGAKAGAILAGTATAVGKFPVDQGFQSVFTTIPPTQLGETAAGSSVVKGAEEAASLLDVVVKPLVLWDELTYGYGEAACAAKSF